MRAFDRMSEFLRPEHFADARHGRIYEALGKLIERGLIANPVTLKNYFEQDNALAEIGGTQYLARLAGSVVTVVNALDYAKTIFDLHLRRQIITLGEDMVNRAFAFDLDAEAKQQIESAEQRLFDLATTGEIEGGPAPFSRALGAAIDLAQTAYKRDSHVTGVTTGLRDLDKKLGGLHPSDLVVLAGRPSMGKTALATKVAFSAALAYKERRNDDGSLEVIEGAKVAFFSLEMSSEQLVQRLLCSEGRIDAQKLRRGKLSQEEHQRLAAAAGHLNTAPIWIDDQPGTNVLCHER